MRSVPARRAFAGWKPPQSLAQPDRVWFEKYEAGALDEDAREADLIQEYEGRIAALEWLVGPQAPELEFVKGVLLQGRLPRSAPLAGC
jgi:hypothetical protein